MDVVIDNFRRGMDRRRARVAGEPGALWEIKNGHLNRGGDIERAKRFVSTYTLPAGTHGLAALKSQLYAFGSADLSGSMPLGVQYQRLQAPNTPTMTRVLDVKVFKGALYVIAEYDDGSIYHFYNGTRVSDWDNVVSATVQATDVAERLAAKINRDSAVSAQAFGAVIQITARTPGTAFTITGSATDGSGGSDATEDLTVAQLQANVAATAEVLATATIQITGGTNDPGTNTINSVTVDGVELLAAVVDWAGSDEATAIRVAAEINNGAALHGYTATVSTDTVTITAETGSGTTPNGDAVVVAITGDVTVLADSTVSGGVAEVAAVAQVEKATISGVCQAVDTFTVTINSVDYKLTGLASGMGTSAYVDTQRIWSTAGRIWYYCDLGDATTWSTGDSGSIDLTETTEGTDVFVTATRYQNLAAVVSPSFTILYALDVDPSNVAVSDTLDSAGTESPHSIVRYGNNDVFFLDTTGIRSLRARDSSNAPFVSDVGNAIDTFVKETLAGLTQQQIVDAVAAIEPEDGRYWLAVGGYIFVLSFFPGSKISGWSYYQPDEFDDEDVSALVRASGRMYVRAGDAVFLYGGADGETYPNASESTCVVKFPFLIGGSYSTKAWNQLGVALTNEWAVTFAYDPNNEARTIEVGRLTKTSFDEMHTNLAGEAVMIAPEFECSDAGAATLSIVVPRNSVVEK